MKDITPYNDKGRSHGYWKLYYNNGNLWRKGNYINGIEVGYWEGYYENGKIKLKEFYI